MSDQRAPQQQVVQVHGPAAGRISGINHIVLFVRDLDEAVSFYRDVLGLKIVRTQPRFSTNALSLQGQALMSSGDLGNEALVDFSVRQVFFQMGNGELFSVYEVDGTAPQPDASVVSFLWPKGSSKPPTRPAKLDHLSFNVETRDDIVWFRDHLRSEDVACSELVERRGSDDSHRFLTSIYFSDPSNNPLEIATFDWGDPGWQGYQFDAWFRDPEPVPSLLDPGHDHTTRGVT
jgi:catechol 2,3-dioxygenase-like lactoylglutathione lyase family enzyme